MSTTLRLVPRCESQKPGFYGLIGAHPCMLGLFEDVRRAAPLELPIVIQGPTGSGKELVAGALHALSGRPGSLVPVNVGAIPEPLAESELFGSIRGAYTGAVADRRGVIESASGGTLVLDEAAELSLPTQVRLLRVLETGMVRAVGSSADREVDFRLLLTTQRPPAELVRQGRWRMDFLYRVSGIVLVVPPLAERPSDLGMLADHWLAQLGRPPLEPDAWKHLQQHDWPGNVRELRRAVEGAVFRAADGPVTALGILKVVTGHGSAESVEGRSVSPRSMKEVERRHIEQVLEETGHNTRTAAALLGMTSGQLYRRYQVLGIVPPRKR